MITRSNLETRKLDLMTEVKDMRAQILAAEREMLAMENQNDSITRIKETHLDGSTTKQQHTSYNDSHLDKLKNAVDLLSAQLEEKDKRIRQLEDLLKLQQNGGASGGIRNGAIIKPVDSRDGGRKPPHTIRPAATGVLTPNGRPHQLSLSNLAHNNSVGSDDSLAKYTDSLPASEMNLAASNNSKRRESSSSESERVRCSTPKSGSSDDRKHGTLRRFFEKFTRSNSSTLNEIPPTPQTFKRGGVRATAGPRLQRSFGSTKKWDPSVPMKNWNQESIIQWIEEEVQLPLTPAAKTWIMDGEHFLKATPQELEKELNLYHPLHKKKLLLALKAFDEQDTSSMGRLDYLWVLRWLDDVGLPQYKDAFADARIDGRMLNFLTSDDLFMLKITNALHHASFKRGIQVLRFSGYDPALIRRRPAKPEAPLEGLESVIYWSNHRVMEWLRSLDLSEYGPNLRGSGVHGALMVLEERFNADVLAELLSIPQSKTLLRRHLSKSFTELVGSDIMRQKRAVEAGISYVPLSPHLKLKPNRRGFSLVRRRDKATDEMQDYVCPLDLKVNLNPKIENMENHRNGSLILDEKKSLSSSSHQLSIPAPIVLSLTV